MIIYCTTCKRFHSLPRYLVRENLSSFIYLFLYFLIWFCLAASSWIFPARGSHGYVGRKHDRAGGKLTAIRRLLNYLSSYNLTWGDAFVACLPAARRFRRASELTPSGRRASKSFLVNVTVFAELVVRAKWRPIRMTVLWFKTVFRP